MKVFLIVIISFLFAITAWAQDYPDSGFTNKAEAKNLMVNGMKEGKWLENLNWQWDVTSDTAFHFYRLAVYKHDTIKGLVRIYRYDGTFCFAIPYLNGKKNGIGRGPGYYQFSDSTVTPFKDDKINGIVKSYIHGSVFTETPYIDGKVNGINKWYYPGSKQIEEEAPFSDDKRSGIAKDYTKKGRLETEYPFVNGKLNGIKKSYYQNGKIKCETPYVNGECIGTEKEYSENGKVEQENIYSDSTNGESNWESISYYPSGSVEMERHYVDDNSDSAERRAGVFGEGSANPITKYGSEKWWYESGKLGIETVYVHDSVMSEKYYDENGNQLINGILKMYYTKKKKRVEYAYIIQNGKLDTLINYNENGTLYLKTPYSNGNKSGTEKQYYYKGGKLFIETLYINGKRNGIEKEYYPNGKLELKSVYINDIEATEQRYDENGNEIK